jgi:hypothetical protein
MEGRFMLEAIGTSIQKTGSPITIDCIFKERS